VLVAEDNERLAELVATALRAAGYDVVVAHDGYRALALVRERGFDALLTDWMMPGLTGDLVAVQARREQPGLPLLLMTAAAGADALAVPWTAVIRKPFALDLLLDAVRAAAGD
jgi:DNA-binding response OmpR family regulator